MKKNKIFIGSGIILFLLLTGLFVFYFQQYSLKLISKDGIFTYIGKADSNEFNPTVIESYKVKVDINSFRKNNIIKLNLPNGINYELTKDYTEPPILEDDSANKPGQFTIINEFTWYGKISKPKSFNDTFPILVKENYIVGNIMAIPGNKFGYSIRGTDSYEVLQIIDPSKFGRD